MKQIVPKFPTAVEIQTTSACNAKCIICPHEHVSKFIPQGLMPNKLFLKILKEIGDKELLLIPYLNAEPFLDPFFFERLEQIKQNCKNVRLEISTNASLLTPERIELLSHFYIDNLRLSVFGFTPETHTKMMPGLNWEKVKLNLDNLVNCKQLRKNTGAIDLVMIYFPALTEGDITLAKAYCRKNGLQLNLWGFLDRAGNVQNYSNNVYKEKNSGCSQDRPIERLHISFGGKVILCCQDWKKEYILGNLNLSSINEIWNSEEYHRIRESIYAVELPSPEICRRCILSV